MLCPTVAQVEEAATRLAADLLSKPWLALFVQKNGRKPVLRVETIAPSKGCKERSPYLCSAIAKKLSQSGKVIVAPAPKKRGATPMAADFVLGGRQVSVHDRRGIETVVMYLFDVELVDADSNSKVWIEQHHIKLVVERAGVEK